MRPVIYDPDYARGDFAKTPHVNNDYRVGFEGWWIEGGLPL